MISFDFIISIAVVHFNDLGIRNIVVLWRAVSIEARLDVNVARGRPSFQVSTYSDQDLVYHPEYANDGNHDTRLLYGPCAHTDAATNPWWAVDLGVPLYVHSVKFTNRNGRGMLSSMSFLPRCM